MKEITVNWHIIQKCNYKCYYCFAKYDDYQKKEIHYSKKEILNLLNKVHKAFKYQYPNLKIRLNIAGGEPTLSKNLSFIIQSAYKIGFDVSIITNASVLTTKFIRENAKYITMFAISIDSLNQNTNMSIGRVAHQKSLAVHKVFRDINLLREHNKSIKIKINTVVTKNNYTEYLGNFISLIKPNKWKVFQALNIDSNKVFCTDKQFKLFVNLHKKMDVKIFTETNNEMTNSYIMIDPHGRFYQNKNLTYEYSKSILDSDEYEVVKYINFDLTKYENRYEACQNER